MAEDAAPGHAGLCEAQRPGRASTRRAENSELSLPAAAFHLIKIPVWTGVSGTLRFLSQQETHSITLLLHLEMAENLSVARPLAQGLLQAFAQAGAALWRTVGHSAPSQGSSSLVEADKQDK